MARREPHSCPPARSGKQFSTSRSELEKGVSRLDDLDRRKKLRLAFQAEFQRRLRLTSCKTESLRQLRSLAAKLAHQVDDLVRVMERHGAETPRREAEDLRLFFRLAENCLPVQSSAKPLVG